MQMDKRGLPLPRNGFVRGEIRNLQRRIEQCGFGELHVFQFDLLLDRGGEIAVHMQGTDYQGRIRDGELVDMRDPGAAPQPVTIDRLYPPGGDREKLEMYVPVTGRRKQSHDRIASIAMALGPIAAILAAISFYYFLVR